MYDALSAADICDYPQELSPTLMFTDYSDPTLPGTNATISCTSDDNSTAIVTFCMDNGNWEPDPRKLCMITGDLLKHQNSLRQTAHQIPIVNELPRPYYTHDYRVSLDGISIFASD